MYSLLRIGEYGLDSMSNNGQYCVTIQSYSFPFFAACGGFIELNDNDPPGYITSPNYPQNYPQNIDCIWVIIVPNGEAVQIDFEDEFYIEPSTRYSCYLLLWMMFCYFFHLSTCSLLFRFSFMCTLFGNYIPPLSFCFPFLKSHLLFFDRCSETH